MTDNQKIIADTNLLATCVERAKRIEREVPVMTGGERLRACADHMEFMQQMKDAAVKAGDSVAAAVADDVFRGLTDMARNRGTTYRAIFPTRVREMMAAREAAMAN